MRPSFQVIDRLSILDDGTVEEGRGSQEKMMGGKKRNAALRRLASSATLEDESVGPHKQDGEDDEDEPKRSRLVTSRTAKTTENQDKTWVCDLCPRKFRAAGVINIGSRRYPRHRCKPCHNATRALDRASWSKSYKSQDVFLLLLLLCCVVVVASCVS